MLEGISDDGTSEETTSEQVTAIDFPEPGETIQSSTTNDHGTMDLGGCNRLHLPFVLNSLH